MSLEALSYRGIETLDKIQGTERGILLGSSISLDFKNTRVAIGHLGNVISQGKVTVSSLIDANSNTWQTSKIITEPSASNGSYFGHAVSMNWKGTRIAVGAYGVDKVYVFDATSTSPNPWATYVSNTISGYTDSNFGYSVSLGQDVDTTLAIGAPNHNRVDVWKLSNSSWSLAYSNIGDDIPNVIPLNSTSGTVTIDSKLSSNVSSLQYGFSCKLAPFGTHLIVSGPGTPLDAISSANSDYSGSNTGFLEPFFPHAKRQSGSARVLVTTDDWVSTVSQLGQTFSGLEYDGSNYITNNGNLFFPTLGYSVAINFDGSVIAMSAPNRQSGTVRVYEYSTVSSSWELRGVDITSGSGLKTGFSIGLDYTGNRVAMSMISNWAFPAVLNAQLYVLDWSGSDWIEGQLPISSKYPGYNYNSETGTKMLSGYKLDITDGNQVAVSRIWWDDNDFQGDDHYTGSGSLVPLSTAVTTFPANQNAYGRVEFYFFLITATFTGNSIFEGYITARELRIGPNDDAVDNTIPKRISFGGTTGDNYYDETLIENRVITGSASELLLHKNHQTNETVDRVRIKASEIHLDHMRMYHSVYQGGQESKNVQSPRFILDQYGTIAIGNLYSGNDSTSTTTSLAETYLDIKAETQIRDKLNVNYKNRSKLLSGHAEYVYMNTRCEDLITSSQIIDETPGSVKVITISNGTGCPYSSTEKAFEFTGTSSGIGQIDITGTWTGVDGMMMFWLKLKSTHSSYASNVLCSWGETLSTVSGVYRGGCLQLTSTGFTFNFGSGIGTRTHATTLDTNKWYHIGVQFPTEWAYDINGGFVNVNLNSLYINGSSVSLSGTLTNSSSKPAWDSQGWHFGYGDASGSIAGPAGTFMGNMMFYDLFNPELITYGYNDGPPSECLSVGGNAIIENRLGVGTTLPARTLDVGGSYNISGGILVRNGESSGGATTPTTPQMAFGWNGSDTYQHFIRTRHNSAAITNNAIDFYVCNTTENNSLSSGVTHNLTLEAGNVGIGTASPSAKLTINSTGTANPGENGIYVYNPTFQSGDAIISARVNGIGGDPYLSLDVASEGGWTFGIDSNDGLKLKWGANWDSLTNNTKMTLDRSGNLVIPTGGVSIGTTATATTFIDLGYKVFNRLISLWGGSLNSSIDSVDYFGIGVNPGALRLNVDSAFSTFKFYGGNTYYGYIWNSGFVDTFTGQHKSFPHESLSGKTTDELSGLIVCASGEHISVNDAIPQRGQDGIMVSEAIPMVCLSSHINDKTVFGVVSNVEDPESTEREDKSGAFTSTFKKIVGDTRIYVNSIGEGAIWVVNTNGSFVNGDYITTSNVAGYGQKQDSDTLKNYTVAKITMECDFSKTLVPKKRIKKKTVT